MTQYKEFGMILQHKVFQKLKLSKMLINEKNLLNIILSLIQTQTKIF